ncbi:MAG: hypothetical protein U0794_23240 [Isosphaeraceae bacterium]
MKSWTAGLARLALAGSLAFWAGCGGSDESTDTPSDASASAESVPGGSAEGPAAPPPAAASEAPVAAAPAGDQAPAPAADAGSAPSVAAEEKPAEKSGAPSATAEMLALASGPAPAPAGAAEGEKPAEGAGQPGAAAGGPGFPQPPGGGGSAMPAGYPGPGGATGYPGQAAGGGMPAGYPGPGGRPSAPGIAAGGGPGAPGQPGAMAGYPGGGAPGAGGPAGIGGLGGDTGGPADFNTPEGAVQAFINALRSKDPERIYEATALRAATESTGAYQKVFAAILEQSLAAEDLDELAKKVEGFQIVSRNPPKSTGKVEIIVGKTGEKGDYLTRKITVRKEKAGWKVCDIAGQREFEKPIILRGGNNRGGTRRGR